MTVAAILGIGYFTWPHALRLVAPCTALHLRCNYSSLSGAFLGEALTCGFLGFAMTGQEWTSARCAAALDLLDKGTKREPESPRNQTVLRSGVPFEIEAGREFIEVKKNGDVIGKAAGRITNKTGKNLVDVNVTGVLTVKFGDRKTVSVESYFWSDRIKPTVSTSRPWRDGESVEFSVKTDQKIDALYREYEATAARFDISLKASDPLDFAYEGIIFTAPINWTDVRVPEKRATKRTQGTDDGGDGSQSADAARRGASGL